MTEKASQSLFKEFAKSNKDGWKQLLNQHLPQVDYSDFIWNIAPGLNFDPLYTRDEWSEDKVHQFITDLNGFPKTCENRPYLTFSGPEGVHHSMLERIREGADGLVIDLNGQANLTQTMLENIDLSESSITLVSPRNADTSMRALLEMTSSPDLLKGGMYCTPINHILVENSSDTDDLETLSKLVTEYSNLADFKGLGIRAPKMPKNRPEFTHELALTLAATARCLESLESYGCPTSKSFSSLEIETVIGDSFFLEISKLRALRFLLGRMGHLYDLEPPKASAFRIQALIQSPVGPDESPLIRLTTRTISALLGGADSLSIKSQVRSSEVDRSAYQIPNILRHESKLTNLSDPCYGSYYIDRLSASLARDAWQKFQNLMSSGGISKFFDSNPDYLTQDEA